MKRNQRATRNPRTRPAALPRPLAFADFSSSGSSLGPEWKDITTNVNISFVVNTGQIIPLNTLVQGTDGKSRVGRKIVIERIDHDMYAYGNLGVPSSSKYALVLDRQPNGILPAWNDIWVQSTPSTLVSTANLDRFHILREWNLSGNGISAGNSNSMWLTQHDQFFQPRQYRKRIPVSFNNGNAGTVADISSNAIYFVALADATGGFVCIGQFRIWFSDA